MSYELAKVIERLVGENHSLLQENKLLQKDVSMYKKKLSKVRKNLGDCLDKQIQFEYEGTMIVDPTMDETGRFKVDPVEYYGKAYTDTKLHQVKK